MNSSLHFFSIPALAPHTAQAEVNLFLQQQRVVALEKQWVADGAASFWSLCVTVVDGAGPLPASLRAPGSSAGGRAGPKVDYREVLSEADFAVFATLRKPRACRPTPCFPTSTWPAWCASGSSPQSSCAA